jgi:hypothetical protein
MEEIIMGECNFCGGPRLNGTPVEKHDGDWVHTSGVSPNVKCACRDCAKEKINGT